MLKNILLGLDDTPASLRARTIALSLARTHGAGLTGFTVVDIERIAHPEPVPLGGDAYKIHKDALLVGRTRLQLQDLVQGFALECDALGVKSTTSLTESDAIDALVSAADVHDLIVIGRDATFHTEGAQLSDIVERLVRSNPRPLIVAPEGDGTGETVVVAYDGSVPAMRALQLYCLLHIADGSELLIASVSADRALADTQVAHAVAYASAHGLKATARVVETDDDPAGPLMKVIDDVRAKFVVMGAYGRRGWRQFLLGSTTDTLLAHAKWPLFIHH
jgi:nucleotide-binding universal stress UspA family protein